MNNSLFSPESIMLIFAGFLDVMGLCELLFLLIGGMKLLGGSTVIGEMISFLDGGGNCSTVNVTISRNGRNIMGSADDLDIDTDNASFTLVYYNASKGWRLID